LDLAHWGVSGGALGAEAGGGKVISVEARGSGGGGGTRVGSGSTRSTGNGSVGRTSEIPYGVTGGWADGGTGGGSGGTGGTY
jgi:hypothetical protein